MHDEIHRPDDAFDDLELTEDESESVGGGAYNKTAVFDAVSPMLDPSLPQPNLNVPPFSGDPKLRPRPTDPKFRG